MSTNYSILVLCNDLYDSDFVFIVATDDVHATLKGLNREIPKDFWIYSSHSTYNPIFHMDCIREALSDKLFTEGKNWYCCSAEYACDVITAITNNSTI